jgi:UDP-N-acetylmuramate--alanine ligase
MMEGGYSLPPSLKDFAVHMVGIKGSGMTALAEVLSARGARVTGSDTAETFYTDSILNRMGIPFKEGFSESNLPSGLRLVVHSAAYGKTDNPELAAATGRGIPIISYPEALGQLSGLSDASGVSGVHGKSTTTAICGAILKAWGFPATVVVGAEVPVFGGRCTLTQGDKYLVAETCEYRRHFLNFHPERIVMTSIEPDHLDYFRGLDDILDAFESYGRSLPFHGAVVYCADDSGASTAAARISRRRDDLIMIPYGTEAEGDFHLTRMDAGEGITRFHLAGFPKVFSLRIPGEHSARNAAAALGLCRELWREENGGIEPDLEAVEGAFASFTGSRRRSEIVGEAGGILFLDDYAHHPTAVEKTLAGFRAFYPGRRLVVDFMPHTYSRTKALMGEFGRCFSPADTVILHRIYASAREGGAEAISGKDLYEEVSRNRPRVMYFNEPVDAVPFLQSELRDGDLFVTMGAGDNWKIGRLLYRYFGGEP